MIDLGSLKTIIKHQLKLSPVPSALKDWKDCPAERSLRRHGYNRKNTRRKNRAL